MKKGEPVMELEPMQAGEQDSDAQFSSNVTRLFPEEGQHLRMLEALLFAAAEPLSEESLTERLPKGADVVTLLEQLAARYEKRGVNLVRVAGKWAFRTAPDLAFLLRREVAETRKLSRAAIETLAIVAYHQPVTRAEIEQVRGVTVSKGTIDVLLEVGWIRPRGRRRVPGRPLTFGTTELFLSQFGLDALGDLPGAEELKSAGFLDLSNVQGLSVPMPREMAEGEMEEDEDPLDAEDLAEAYRAEAEAAPEDEEPEA
jgi:segregation and condensation protein B